MSTKIIGYMGRDPVEAEPKPPLDILPVKQVSAHSMRRYHPARMDKAARRIYKAQERITDKLLAKTQAAILALMEQAILRACKGVKPSPEDMREHAKLFDNPRTGQMQLWWLGETVLLLTPSADGPPKFTFMGSASEPLPKAHDPWDRDEESPDPWKRAFPAP